MPFFSMVFLAFGIRRMGRLYKTGQPGQERPQMRFKKPKRDIEIRDEYESDDEDLDARERARRRAKWSTRFNRYASCCIFRRGRGAKPKAEDGDEARSSEEVAMEEVFAEDLGPDEAEEKAEEKAEEPADAAADAEEEEEAEEADGDESRPRVTFADAPGDDEDAATVAAYYAKKGREMLYANRDPPKEKRRSSRSKRGGDEEKRESRKEGDEKRRSRKEGDEKRRSSKRDDGSSSSSSSKSKEKRRSSKEAKKRDQIEDDVDDFLSAEASVAKGKAAAEESARSSWFGACTAPSVEEELEYPVQVRPIAPEEAPVVDDSIIAPSGGLCMG